MERDLKSALKGYWKDLNAKQRAIIRAIIATTDGKSMPHYNAAMDKAHIPERTFYRQLKAIRSALKQWRKEVR